MEIGELSTGEQLALGGGGVGIVGAMLPWVSVNPGIGFEWNREIVVLFMSLLTVGLVFVADWTETMQLVTGAVGALTTGVSGYTLAELFDIVGSKGFYSAEYGLYLSLVAGIMILAGAAHSYTDDTATAGMYSHR